MFASARSSANSHPRATVVVLSVVGYGLVLGTFAGVIPAAAFPTLSQG